MDDSWKLKKNLQLKGKTNKLRKSIAKHQNIKFRIKINFKLLYSNLYKPGVKYNKIWYKIKNIIIWLLIKYINWIYVENTSVKFVNIKYIDNVWEKLKLDFIIKNNIISL